MPSNQINGSTNGSAESHRSRPDYAAFPQDVGILAMEMYFPSMYVDQTELEQYDGVSAGKYTIGLGQAKMGFCSDREDTYSMALTVVKRLMERTAIDPRDVGFLMVGTESLLDKSKSVKSVLMQLFAESGNADILAVDTYNACYGGTAALFHAIQWVESSFWDGRMAIVVAVDNAIYATGAARPTGGAGAVAMLVGPNAPLSLERGTVASHMEHSYDFYKPVLSSEYPTVDGKETIRCYYTAVDKCYQLFAQKIDSQERRVNGGDSASGKVMSVDDFDGILLHSPYGKLVQKSIARLILNEFLRDPNPDYEVKYKGLEPYRNAKLEDTYTDRDLEKILIGLSTQWYKIKTQPSLLLSNQIGNMYTASLYSCLVSYLLSKPLDQLAGKRIALFSYGSGLASSMFAMRISPDASDSSLLSALVAGIRDVPQRLADRKKVPPKEFEAILQKREETHLLAPYTPCGSVDDLFPGTLYLTGTDDMWRRKYDRTPLESNNNNNTTSTPASLKQAAAASCSLYKRAATAPSQVITI